MNYSSFSVSFFEGKKIWFVVCLYFFVLFCFPSRVFCLGKVALYTAYTKLLDTSLIRCLGNIEPRADVKHTKSELA